MVIRGELPDALETPKGEHVTLLICMIALLAKGPLAEIAVALMPAGGAATATEVHDVDCQLLPTLFTQPEIPVSRLIVPVL